MHGNSPSRVQVKDQEPASATAASSAELYQAPPAPAASGAFDPAPQTTSDIQIQEPPLVTVTSDLPEYGGSPSPRPHNLPHPTLPPAPQSATSTPGSKTRLEVVLNVTPYRPLPGHSLWKEADLDDPHADLLTGLDGSPSRSKKRRRRRAPDDRAGSVRKNVTTASAASSHLHARTTTTTPGPGTAGKRARGRPKGSTKIRYVDEDGNPVAAPPRAIKATPGTAKRRGRPPRAPPPSVRMVWESVAPPTYVSFLCEWTGCKAELQNVETLRRHVHKLHGLWKGDEGVVCRWGKCGRQLVPGEEKVLAEQEFYEHMEAKHLVPLVWHVGDGVRNDLHFSSMETTEQGEEIPAYLLGPDGEQVTPWVKGQVEEDLVTRKLNRQRLRAILFQRDENAPLADEDLEALELEQEDTGSPTPPV